MPRSVLVVLISAGLILPLAQGVLFWVAKLLAAMQDTAGQAWVDRLSLACGVLWAIDLTVLVVALGIHALGPPPPREGGD